MLVRQANGTLTTCQSYSLNLLTAIIQNCSNVVTSYLENVIEIEFSEIWQRLQDYSDTCRSDPRLVDHKSGQLLASPLSVLGHAQLYQSTVCYRCTGYVQVHQLFAVFTNFSHNLKSITTCIQNETESNKHIGQR